MSKVRTAVLVLALVAAMAACGTSSEGVSKTGGTGSSASSAATGSSGAATPTDVTVQVGVNDPNKPNIAVLAYMPAKVTVEVGAPLAFSWSSTIEPHSVTFLTPGQVLPDPGSDPSLFAPTPATGPIDGSTFVNSGLAPLGPAAVPPMEVTFAKAGTFEFHCVIHPTMVGTVDVVAKGASGVDTPAAAAARGAGEQAKWLDEGRKAEADFAKKAPESTKNADGSTTWKLHMGATTEHTDILEFQPVPANVKAGDTVTFLNDSGAPHTASFFGKTAPITDPTDPRTDVAAPGPSPQTLDGNAFFNSGLLPPNAPPGSGPPEVARSFSFVIPKAGTYPYVCILHVPSGMAGTVTAT